MSMPRSRTALPLRNSVSEILPSSGPMMLPPVAGSSYGTLAVRRAAVGQEAG